MAQISLSTGAAKSVAQYLIDYANTLAVQGHNGSSSVIRGYAKELFDECSAAESEAQGIHLVK